MIRDTPTSPRAPPRYNTVEFDGRPPPSVYDRDPGMRVRYVHPSWGPTTDWAPVAPAPGPRPYQVRASWQVAACTAGSLLAAAGQSSLDPQAVRPRSRSPPTGARYYDAAGEVLAADPPPVWCPSARCASRASTSRSTGALRAGVFARATVVLRRRLHPRSARRGADAMTAVHPAAHATHHRPGGPQMTISQEQATRFAHDLRPARRQRRAGGARQAPRDRTRAHGDAERRPRAARGRPRHRQDLARARPRAVGARARTRASSSRPTSCRRHHRHHGVRPEDRHVRVPRRAGVREHRARRRDQQGEPQDPVRAARGDGGGQGHHRRRSRARSACPSS